MLASNEPLLIEDPIVLELAKKYNKSAAQIILNWSVARGTVVIPKTVTPSRAKENLESSDFELNQEDIKKIDGINKDYRYVNGRFFTPDNGPYTYENIWDEGMQHMLHPASSYSIAQIPKPLFVASLLKILVSHKLIFLKFESSK